MTVHQVHLQRSIASMTVKLQKAVAQKAAASTPYGLCEREQQFQLNFSGNATNTPTEQTTDISFDVAFLSDTGSQRDSSLEVPQMRIGWEFSVYPAGLIPYAFATAWTYDDGGSVVGVTMNIGVYAPAATDLEAFTGKCHLSFEGFGAPIDNETDDSPGTDIDNTDDTDDNPDGT